MRFVARRAASRRIRMIIFVSARKDSGSPRRRPRQGISRGAPGEPSGLVPVLAPAALWKPTCGYHFGGQPPAVPADRAQPFCRALLGDLRRAARVPCVRQRRPLSGHRSSVGLRRIPSGPAVSVRCRTAADERLAARRPGEVEVPERSGVASARRSLDLHRRCHWPDRQDRSSAWPSLCEYPPAQRPPRGREIAPPSSRSVA